MCLRAEVLGVMVQGCVALPGLWLCPCSGEAVKTLDLGDRGALLTPCHISVCWDDGDDGSWPCFTVWGVCIPAGTQILLIFCW